MCGIVGGVGPDSPNRIQLDNQLRLLEHRGPDGKGSFFGNNFSLGMCRLAIVEIQNGIQPASDEKKKIHLVFNGEIYNYLELQKKYNLKFIDSKPNSEAQVLLGLYQLMGINFVQVLDGMFAIAIYDENSQELYLIRDRVGEKPLYYTISSSGTLLFSSESKALYDLIPRKTFRTNSINEVMTFGYVPGPSTAIEEIKILPPGHFGKFNSGSLSINEYWVPDFKTEINIEYEDAKKITKDLIREAVRKRLISERSLGSFLSGGIDSTVVTSQMVELSPGNVSTYSIGFEDSSFDESSYAREISHWLGTNHAEMIVKPDPIEIINQISKTLDQPFADSSIIPTLELAKFASRGVTVALGGDGGDELFGGYNRYRAAPKLQKINSLLRIFGTVGPRLSNTGFIRNRSFKRILEEMTSQNNLASRYKSIMSLTKETKLTELILAKSQVSTFELKFIEDFVRQGTKDDLSAMIRSDFEYYLPGDLLIKSDMATMAHGIELRSPLLDIKLIEWVHSLPSIFKIKGNIGKFILKDIADELVPNKLINRPKMGFAIPRSSWIRNELWEISNDLLTDNSALNRGWFNQKEVVKTLKLHKSGKDYDSVIWPMLMLEVWARKWLD